MGLKSNHKNQQKQPTFIVMAIAIAYLYNLNPNNKDYENIVQGRQGIMLRGGNL
jgi:hypothetical protein